MLTKLRQLNTLVKMQLKAKIDLSFFKKKDETIIRIVFLLIGFAVVTAAIYFAFYISVTQYILTLTLKLPLKDLVFIFTVMQMLSIITTTAKLVRSLYFSGDNQILLTMPVPQNLVFISKLIVFYILELKKNIIFLMPVFIAFGLINNYSAGYYPVVLVSFLFISMLPVALAAVLSIPACFVTMILRDMRILQLILALAAAASITYFFFSMIALIPANLDIIGSFGMYYWRLDEFLNTFNNAVPPFAALIRMVTGRDYFTWHKPLTGETFVILLELLGAVAFLLALSFLAARPLYFRMVSKPYEYKSRRLLFKRKNKKLPKFFSALKKELLLIFRSPHTLFNTFISLFVLPLAIFLLNKIFSAMHTRLLGDYMSMSFNVLMMLLIMLNSNISAASIFSSEGSAVYIVKTKPETVYSALAAKLFVYLTASVFSAALTAYLIFRVNSMGDTALSLNAAVFIFLIAICTSVGHIFWGVQSDITNPQYQNYVGGSHTGTNPNETLSTITAFILSFVLFGITLFLLKENAAVAWIKVFSIALIFLIARTYLLISNIKVYFKSM